MRGRILKKGDCIRITIITLNINGLNTPNKKQNIRINKMVIHLYIVHVVVWMNIVPIDSFVWILSPQLMGLFEKDKEA